MVEGRLFTQIHNHRPRVSLRPRLGLGLGLGLRLRLRLSLYLSPRLLGHWLYSGSTHTVQFIQDFYQARGRAKGTRRR